MEAAFIQQSDSAPWHVTRLRGYRNRQSRAGVQLRHIPSLPADRFRADDEDGWPFFSRSSFRKSWEKDCG